MLGIVKNLKRKNKISTFNGILLIYFFLIYLNGRLIAAYGKLNNNIY